MLHGLHSALGGFVRPNSIRGLATESEKKRTQSITCDYNAMKVVVMPECDKYTYLLIDTVSNEAAAVDPIDLASLTQRIHQENVKLTTVLLTHYYSWHWHYRSDIDKFIAEVTDNKLTIVTGYVENHNRADAIYKNILSDGDELKLGSLTVKGLYSPGHTNRNICYYITGPGAKHPILFTGELLLIAGCGSFCDDYTKTNALLNEKLASLPDDTQVFCREEKTLKNLKFATAVEPENEAISQRLQHLTEVRQNLLPTVPSTIGEEKKTNPYMRVAKDTVQSYVQARSVTRAMGCLKRLENEFHEKNDRN